MNDNIPEEVKDAAKALAGNYTEVYWWWEKGPADPENWALHPTTHPYSGLIDQSNAAFVLKLFPDQRGYVMRLANNIAIRAYTPHGRVTKVFQRFYAEVLEPLSQYPILDDDGLSELECEEEWQAVKGAVEWFFDFTLPFSDDQLVDVISLIVYNNDSDRYGLGSNDGVPDDDTIVAALVALGLPSQHKA